MFDDYRAMGVFVVVAETGSFTEAGRRLDLTPAAVSGQINKLEKSLEVALFHRSTRALSLTVEGSNMLAHAKRMVAAANDAIGAVSTPEGHSVGELRISMPAFGENSPIFKSVLAFAALNPKVRIHMQNIDQITDLVKHGYDLGIRPGPQKDSALKCLKIAEFDRVLVASPAFLSRAPKISDLVELENAEFVGISSLPRKFALQRGDKKAELTPRRIRTQVSSVNAAKAAVVAGLGVQRLPAWEIGQELATGSLVQILPEWSLPSLSVYAVWSNQARQNKILRALLSFITNTLKENQL